MSATYSINIGTVREATTDNNIIDVLFDLLDNTQKIIRPRDVRDAIFSVWENSIFRYTQNSTGEYYIGIDRDTIKDKIFIGKKSFTGTEIINAQRIASDTDIFLYNTKSDSAPTQNLKITFLSGDDRAIDQYAPYISADKITVGASGYINFSIIHTNPLGGNIIFTAGSTGNILLNNLRFPSVTQIAAQITSPSSVGVGDTFLVRTSTGAIELKSATFSGSSSITTFTDLRPTPIELGGVPFGSTFSNVPLEEMIRILLYPELGPLVITMDLLPAIKERNNNGDTVTFQYTLLKRVTDISSTTITVDGILTTPISGGVITGSGFQTQIFAGTQSYTGLEIQNTDPLNTGDIVTLTFSVTTTDGTQSNIGTGLLEYVYPYFYGYSATNSSPDAQIAANVFTKHIDSYGSQSVPIQGDGWLHYCYPSIYGPLYEIRDGNDLIIWQIGSSSTAGDWTYSVIPGVMSPDGYWGPTTYYVYHRTVETTVLNTQNFKFIY